MKIVQIVPGLIPSVSGIIDYALVLAEQLLKNYGIATQFLDCQPSLKTDLIINDFPSVRLPARSPKSFLECLPKNGDVLILHYAKYVYDSKKYSAPFWLWKALRNTMKERKYKLFVIFHDMPFLKRTNFFHLLQGFVAQRIARMSREIITNCSQYAANIQRWSKRPVITIPVFSNIGEPLCIPPMAQRKPQMIIFGGISRYWVYKSANKVIRACEYLKIKEVYDVGNRQFGPGNLSDIFKKNGISLFELGTKSAEETSGLMLASKAGFFDSSKSPGYLGKSGVFAAYCAHGLLPITGRYNPSEKDGIELNKHYVAVTEYLESLTSTRAQAVSDNCRMWYRTHTQGEHARVFAELLLKE